jgi:hypothetical protein
MALFFGRRRAVDKRRRSALINLMLLIRALLKDKDDAVVSISDHVCIAAGCRESPQTTILIVRADQPSQVFKIAKPLEAVREADLVCALPPLINRTPALPAA